MLLHGDRVMVRGREGLEKLDKDKDIIKRIRSANGNVTSDRYVPLFSDFQSKLWLPNTYLAFPYPGPSFMQTVPNQAMPNYSNKMHFVKLSLSYSCSEFASISLCSWPEQYPNICLAQILIFIPYRFCFLSCIMKHFGRTTVNLAKLAGQCSRRKPNCHGQRSNNSL